MAATGLPEAVFTATTTQVNASTSVAGNWPLSNMTYVIRRGGSVVVGPKTVSLFDFPETLQAGDCLTGYVTDIAGCNSPEVTAKVA